MCTSCALAFGGVDNGERCILLDTWHGYAREESIYPHVWVRACDSTFVASCGHTCGEPRVDIFVSAVALHVWGQTMLDGTTKYFHYLSSLKDTRCGSRFLGVKDGSSLGLVLHRPMLAWGVILQIHHTVKMFICRRAQCVERALNFIYLHGYITFNI